MNTSINFNEVRKLAKQAAKKRPILGCMRIEDGKAFWTDAYYLVLMDSYKDTPNMTVDLSDYSSKNQDYPDAERIVDKPFTKRDYKEEIHEGEVIYLYERIDTDGEVFKSFIDSTHINQLKKLIQNKKFNLNISEIELNETNTMGRITVDPLTKIYFMLKRKGN